MLVLIYLIPNLTWMMSDALSKVNDTIKNDYIQNLSWKKIF